MSPAQRSLRALLPVRSAQDATPEAGGSERDAPQPRRSQRARRCERDAAREAKRGMLLPHRFVKPHIPKIFNRLCCFESSRGAARDEVRARQAAREEALRARRRYARAVASLLWHVDIGHSLCAGDKRTPTCSMTKYPMYTSVWVGIISRPLAKTALAKQVHSAQGAVRMPRPGIKPGTFRSSV